MFELGINTNNDCEKNIIKNLQLIKQAGFESVMVSFKSGQLEDGLIEAQKLGLKVPYVHLTSTDHFWCKGELNKEFMQTLKEQISICQKYKVKVAVLHATQGQANQLALPPTQHALDCVKQIVAYAKKCNVKIALENLDAPNFKHFTFLMDNIVDPYLGFCYDAGHHNLYNPKVDLLKKYGNRLLAVHLHDNLMDWEYGYDWTRDVHLLPLDGKINYNKICLKLAQTNYTGPIMLEVHKMSCADPYLYNNLSNKEYLKIALDRANQLAKKIKVYRKKQRG